MARTSGHQDSAVIHFTHDRGMSVIPRVIPPLAAPATCSSTRTVKMLPLTLRQQAVQTPAEVLPWECLQMCGAETDARGVQCPTDPA
jgi:hypothetical protein